MKKVAVLLTLLILLLSACTPGASPTLTDAEMATRVASILTGMPSNTVPPSEVPTNHPGNTPAHTPRRPRYASGHQYAADCRRNRRCIDPGSGCSDRHAYAQDAGQHENSFRHQNTLRHQRTQRYPAAWRPALHPGESEPIRPDGQPG